MKILITGVAGFVGMHAATRFCNDGHQVIGIDNLNDYYDVELKKRRLAQISEHQKFKFYRCDLARKDHLISIFDECKPDVVLNFAAQAGVRFSIENPDSYIQSNLVGFANVLDCAKDYGVKHLIYASSSSVYGANTNLPYHEGQNVDHPLTLYGATKKANELLAHSYSNLFKLPTTGLRFFTVYGPWGRPDMAYFKFTKAIQDGDEIEIFNYGNMDRDFTFIDDVTNAISLLLNKPPKACEDFDSRYPDPGKSSVPWEVFNIGNSNPVKLMDCVEIIERLLGKKAKKKFIEMQPGDVISTASDCSRLAKWVNFRANTDFETGMRAFIDWYLNYFKEER